MERSRIGQIMLPAAVVLVVAVMILPLPAAVLDVLIVANLSTAIIILLVSMNVKSPSSAWVSTWPPLAPCSPTDMPVT